VAPQSISAPRAVSRKATGSQSPAVTAISMTAVSLRPVRDDEPDVTDVPIGHRLAGRGMEYLTDMAGQLPYWPLMMTTLSSHCPGPAQLASDVGVGGDLPPPASGRASVGPVGTLRPTRPPPRNVGQTMRTTAGMESGWISWMLIQSSARLS
jgi:hypothetical protein